jgi:hypothetical protein
MIAGVGIRKLASSCRLLIGDRYPVVEKNIDFPG